MALRTLRLGATLVVPVALLGCTSLLPSSRTDAPSFQSFAAARETIESVQPFKSTVATLKDQGISPTMLPNTVILTYSDIIHRVVSSNILTKQDLDPGVVHCIDARDACRGWEISVSHVDKKRNGNFWSDVFNFSRHTQTTGWRFNALILMVDDTVVYRTWGGQPTIHTDDEQNNPLGPLQAIF